MGIHQSSEILIQMIERGGGIFPFAKLGFILRWFEQEFAFCGLAFIQGIDSLHVANLEP